MLRSLQAPRAQPLSRIPGSQCALSQSGPMPIPTSSGMESVMTFLMMSATPFATSSAASCLTSITSSSWTCSESLTGLSSMNFATFTIASLIRSAAEPWSGALVATRSAARSAMPFLDAGDEEVPPGDGLNVARAVRRLKEI